MEPTNNLTFNLVSKEISQNSKLKIKEKVIVLPSKLKKLRKHKVRRRDNLLIQWTAQTTNLKVLIFREKGLLLKIMKNFQI